MKRALLGTLWIGAVAAAVAIGLQLSEMLVRPATALVRANVFPPNVSAGFANFVIVILLSLAVAWTMLQAPSVGRRAALFVLLVLELVAAA